jgi:hypothetical protein
MIFRDRGRDRRLHQNLFLSQRRRDPQFHFRGHQSLNIDLLP